MATSREQDILRIIKENPLVSQQQLAQRCGITRSSVGVHVSNLMKKGLIQGRGYILPSGPYAVVVGSANLDVGGRPAAKMVPRDSNPGTVTFSPGGVGRNIAHNLALLGAEVRFVSVFGSDAGGTQLADSCRRAGVDISLCPVLEQSSAVYMYITGHTGEMELAVSDMGIYDAMDPAFLAERLDAVNNAVLCVADTNPPAETLRHLAENCAPPLVVDPVSTTKAKKLAGLLGRIHTLKCNRVEAELLSGIDIKSDAALEKAARQLLGEGLRQLVITLGEKGALCADETGLARLPHYPGPMADVTGAGDAFTAALAAAMMQGKPLAEAAKLGLAAAALCIAGSGTISADMSAERLQQVVQSGRVE